MFICQITKRTSNLHEKCNKVIAVYREKIYRHYNEETEEEWESYGREPVLELSLSDEGLAEWQSWDETKRAAFVKRLNG